MFCRRLYVAFVVALLAITAVPGCKDNKKNARLPMWSPNAASGW